jgi:hypothetical protein
LHFSGEVIRDDDRFHALVNMELRRELACFSEWFQQWTSRDVSVNNSIHAGSDFMINKQLQLCRRVIFAVGWVKRCKERTEQRHTD